MDDDVVNKNTMGIVRNLLKAIYGDRANEEDCEDFHDLISLPYDEFVLKMMSTRPFKIIEDVRTQYARGGFVNDSRDYLVGLRQDEFPLLLMRHPPICPDYMWNEDRQG